MPRSIWKGAISFGLVTIPVKLFSATEEKDRAEQRKIEERIAIARRQLEQQAQFDFVVRNDDKLRAADELARIIARCLAGADSNNAATMARQ